MAAKTKKKLLTITFFVSWTFIFALCCTTLILVERNIWGAWPPPMPGHYLHFIRGLLIVSITSVFALGIIHLIIKEEIFVREELALFSRAVEYSTDAILLTDPQGKILHVNSAFSKLYGYSFEEAVGQTTRFLRSHYSSDEFYRDMWLSINTKGEWKGEIVNKAKDGSEIPVWLSITAVFHKGQKIGYMGIELDMREKKDLERRAIEAERLAAVGRMSSQVAHEVRNPLSSISLNVELLREEFESLSQSSDAAKLKEAGVLLRAIEKEVDRLAELAGDYLKFSRLPQHNKKLTNLDDLCAALFGFLKEEARRRHIRIVFEKSAVSFYASVDPKQIEQALLNLAKNAFDAMPEGGRVHAGIREEAGSTVIFIRDEGIGMDEETLKKVFDPFFTTKEKGSGLGLSLVRQVVSEHGGSVWCESVKNQGTTFYMRLPGGLMKERVG